MIQKFENVFFGYNADKLFLASVTGTAFTLRVNIVFHKSLSDVSGPTVRTLLLMISEIIIGMIIMESVRDMRRPCQLTDCMTGVWGI